MALEAALTAPGLVTVAAGASVSGMDGGSGGRPDCVPAADGDTARAGVRSGVPVAGTGSVTGQPASQVDATLSDSTFLRLGDLSVAELARRAGARLGGGTFAPGPVLSPQGQCDRSVAANWGDGVGTGPCADHAPLIHVGGDATLTGGHGQGMLLVEGDLVLTGDFQFAGVIIVTGALVIRGPVGPSGEGVRLTGAVVARSVTIEPSGAPAAIRYSNCFVGNALRSAGTVAPLRSRGWAQLF
jgi:hypothetical protein